MSIIVHQPDEDVMKQVKNDIKEKIKQKKAMKKGNNNKDGETPVQLDWKLNGEKGINIKLR